MRILIRWLRVITSRWFGFTCFYSLSALHARWLVCLNIGCRTFWLAKRTRNGHECKLLLWQIATAYFSLELSYLRSSGSVCLINSWIPSAKSCVLIVTKESAKVPTFVNIAPIDSRNLMSLQRPSPFPLCRVNIQSAHPAEEFEETIYHIVQDAILR